MKLDYYFFRIDDSTDQMMEAFGKIYNTDQKSIVVHDLTGDINALMPTVLKCVTTSVTAFVD